MLNRRVTYASSRNSQKIGLVSRQRGYVSSVEMAFGLLPFLAFLFLFVDITRYYNTQEQFQETAFALASVVANRSVAANEDPLAKGIGSSEELQDIESLAKVLMPSRAKRIKVLVQEFAPDKQASGVTLGGTCNAKGLKVEQALPFYSVRVTVCDSEKFDWWSLGGFIGELNGDVLMSGSALLPER